MATRKAKAAPQNTKYLSPKTTPGQIVDVTPPTFTQWQLFSFSKTLIQTAEIQNAYLYVPCSLCVQLHTLFLTLLHGRNTVSGP